MAVSSVAFVVAMAASAAAGWLPSSQAGKQVGRVGGSSGGDWGCDNDGGGSDIPPAAGDIFPRSDWPIFRLLVTLQPACQPVRGRRRELCSGRGLSHVPNGGGDDDHDCDKTRERVGGAIRERRPARQYLWAECVA
jgi:hypothetical protein